MRKPYFMVNRKSAVRMGAVLSLSLIHIYGQLCDIIIDKAALDAIYHAGKSSGNEFLKLYAELTVAAADIKTAVRASRTGKDRAFLEQALAPCDTLDITCLLYTSRKFHDKSHRGKVRKEALRVGSSAHEKSADLRTEKGPQGHP